MHHGVALSEAEAMSTRERMAAYIIHGELEGGVWDWRGMRWKDPKK